MYCLYIACKSLHTGVCTIVCRPDKNTWSPWGLLHGSFVSSVGMALHRRTESVIVWGPDSLVLCELALDELDERKEVYIRNSVETV